MLDTNLVVSALLFGGIPRILLNLILAKEIAIVVSDNTSQELYDTLHKVKFAAKFADLSKTPRQMYNQFVSVTEHTETSPLENVNVRDPKDVIILECAVSGFATHIVTGDKDLLSLKSYADILIVTPSHFLSLLKTTPETTATSDE